MKYTLLLFLCFGLAPMLKSQISLEQQIADTACICLSALDTNDISSKSNGMKMACLQQAMIKNQENIRKQYETELRKEEDEEKHGLKGSLMIKVQNILAEKCASYQLFESKIQERHEP